MKKYPTVFNEGGNAILTSNLILRIVTSRCKIIAFNKYTKYFLVAIAIIIKKQLKKLKLKKKHSLLSAIINISPIIIY